VCSAATDGPPSALGGANGGLVGRLLQTETNRVEAFSDGVLATVVCTAPTSRCFTVALYAAIAADARQLRTGVSAHFLTPREVTDAQWGLLVAVR
jgi:hypothetical protein